MKKVYVKIGLFIAVLIFTFILRSHNYDRTPAMGHLEEQMFAWAGIHLIERGIPRAWTSLDFPEESYVYKGAVSYQGGDPVVHVNLVEPWLEHPPVFSLIVGWFAHLYGADRDGVIPTAYIRMPVVIMAVLSSIMVFLIARLIAGYWSGLLAMLIYGTTPIIVLGSRMAVPENLISLIYLIIIFLLIKYQNVPRFRLIALIPLLSGIAGLAKATGYLTLALPIYVLLNNHRFKSVAYLLIGIIPFIVLFFLYGLHFSPEIFWRINAIQTSRPVGFKSLGWFFVSPAFDITELIDSWFIFLLLAAAYFLFTAQASLKKFLAISLILWIGVVMFSGGETDLLPWYRYPSYPVLSIIGALVLIEIVKKADIFSAFLAGGLLLGSRSLLVNPFRPNISPIQYRLIIASILTPALTYTIFKKDILLKLSRLFIIIVIMTGMFFNVKYIYNHFEINCENITCTMGPSTSLSIIKFPLIWRLFVLGEPTYR